jgi:hypothetical protein
MEGSMSTTLIPNKTLHSRYQVTVNASLKFCTEHLSSAMRYAQKKSATLGPAVHLSVWDYGNLVARFNAGEEL